MKDAQKELESMMARIKQAIDLAPGQSPSAESTLVRMQACIAMGAGLYCALMGVKPSVEGSGFVAQLCSNLANEAQTAFTVAFVNQGETPEQSTINRLAITMANIALQACDFRLDPDKLDELIAACKLRTGVEEMKKSCPLDSRKDIQGSIDRSDLMLNALSVIVRGAVENAKSRKAAPELN